MVAYPTINYLNDLNGNLESHYNYCHSIHQILSVSIPLFRKFAFYIAFTPNPLRNYHNPNKPMDADFADDNSHYHYAIYLHLFSLLLVDACHQSSAVKNIFVFLKKYLPNPKKYLDYNLTLVNLK